jgi:hypothetical protein
MIKIKKAKLTRGKADIFKDLENKVKLSDELLFNDLYTEINLFENEWSVQNSKRWKDFKNRYKNEFDNKIELMDKIMTQKKNKLNVTWISVFK